MKALLAIVSLLLAVSPQALAREHCQLERLQEEIRWCLVEAPGDVPGRDRMMAALQRGGTETDLYNFRIGFADCYDRDQDKLRNFLQCRRADPISVLNYGRLLLDLPPIAAGS